MKVSDKIKNKIDTLVKNNRKNLIIGLFVLTTVGLGFTLSNTYRDRADLRASVATLENSYNQLAENSKSRLDSLEMAHKATIVNNDRKIDSLSSLYYIQRNLSVKLQKELDALQNTDVEVPVDSAYAYINTTYPSISEPIFKLDTFQIKTFYKVDLSNKASRLLINSLSLDLKLSDNLNTVLSNQNKEYKNLYGVATSKYDMLLNDNKKLVIELDDVKGDYKREKFFRTTLGTALVTVGVLVVVKNILKND
jgi:hypothetical protein